MIKANEYAICGLGITKHGKVPGISRRMFHAEALRLAIEDAGLTRDDIDGYICEPAGSGRASGQSEDDPARTLGLPVHFHWQMLTGGPTIICGIAAAIGAIELGMAKHVILVYADNAYSAGASPFYAGRPFQATDAVTGINVTYGLAGAAALIAAPIARAHMARYGTTTRQLGAITVAERQYAAVNPDARFFGKPITIEDHENSPLVADPIRVLDCCVESDGGIAIIVTSAERARNCKSKPAYIKGIGTGTNFHLIAKGHSRDSLVESDAVNAGQQAFRMAGCDLKDIDVAQIYDAFTPVVLIQLEDYGFCKKGEGGPWVEAGNMDPGKGKIPINTSGGQLGWDYIVGMTPLSEAIRQARGECGDRQVKDVELSMATAFGGAATQSHGYLMGYAQGCIVLGCGR